MKRKWVVCIAVSAFLVAFGAFKLDYSTPHSGCAFCNPAVLENQTVYHGELASVVLTYKPAVPGHLLVIPNRHVQRFEEMTEGEIREIGELIKRIKSVQGKAEYVLLEKNGRGVGQSVPHVHVHVLPKPADMGTWNFILRVLMRPLFKPESSMSMNLRLDEMNDFN